MVRIVKISIVVFAAFFCLMYAVQNIVNLQAGFGFVALMVGMSDHLAYPNHLGFPIKSPMLIWAMLWTIIILELAAGLLYAKGAFDLWLRRKASAVEFNSGKDCAVLGAGVAIIIWFGIFSAIGGAYFQMWQTEAGASVLHNSFWFTLQHGLILLMLLIDDR